MTKRKKIKAEWASLVLAPNGTPIICVESEKSLICLRFKSLEQLGDTIKNRKIFASKWALAVPRDLCILKKISLPASDLDEAYRMVEFELPSLVPMSLDEVVYGCVLLNKQDNLINVLVYISKQDLLEQYLKQYNDIGIKPQKILLELLALQNWFNVTAGFASGLGISICVNKHNCHILTWIDGYLDEMQELRLSPEDVTISSQKIVQEIIAKYRRPLSSPEKEKKIAIVGEQEYAFEIKNLFQKNSQNFASYKIDVIASPSVTYYGDIEYSDNISGDFYYETIVAVGLLKLAAGSKLEYSNLLPRQHIKKAHKKVLLLNYLVTSSLSIILITLLWLNFVFMNWRLEWQSQKIQSRISPIENIVSSVDSKQQRVQAIQRQVSNRGLMSRIFRELYYYTPKTISISELKFNIETKGANIDIKGQADTLADAFGYTETIGKSDLLHEMQITNAQQVPRPGGSIVEFKANCLIKTR